MKYTNTEGELQMLVEKNMLKSDLSYSDDKSKRYMLRLEWEKAKPKMSIIMLSAGSSDGICFDKTTNLVIENALKSGYGSVDILNLFPSVDRNFNEQSDSENLKFIDTSAKSADIIIFAAGTGQSGNKKIIRRQNDVLIALKKYDKKLYCISDDKGKRFYHPLCPKVKEWKIEKFDVEELIRKEYQDD